MNNLGIIILAAGLGTRMKSGLPKVLHCIGGKPILSYPLKIARSLSPQKLAIVVGHGADAVRRVCADGGVSWVLQDKQLGTGDAARSAQEAFSGFSGNILILSGDAPLITRDCLERLMQCHDEQNATLTFVTARLEKPRGYGRILRDRGGAVTGIVEEKDASETEKKIAEINAGIYAVAADFLFSALARLGNANRQQEYYLTDIVAAALAAGATVGTVEAKDAREIMGINTREELALMEKTLQERINRGWMAAGVTLKDPETIYIEDTVKIGKDTHLLGDTIIGERCRIDGSAYLTNAKLADDVHLKFSVVMTDSQIEDGAIIGPFAHLRPGTRLGRGVHIGNFVETKEATIGAGTKANHLTYLGDVTIGRETNIGAGTITCNYDGFKKYRTKIGDRVQVGSDSTLVAPITLGDDVYVATATTIRRDVPAGALAYNQRNEKTKEGWTEEKRRSMGKNKA